MELSNQLNGVKVSSIVVNPLDEPKLVELWVTRLLFTAVHNPATVHDSRDRWRLGSEDGPLGNCAAAVGAVLGLVGSDLHDLPTNYGELGVQGFDGTFCGCGRVLGDLVIHLGLRSVNGAVTDVLEGNGSLRGTCGYVGREGDAENQGYDDDDPFGFTGHAALLAAVAIG